MREQTLINFKIEPELKERLIALAEKDHRTLSGLIKHVLLNYAERQETGNDGI